MNGFDEASAPLRTELLAHCYRMLGSWDDAEDAVQDTYLRGYRAFDSFDGRSSVRTWMYRIATNVCLNAVRDRGRRALPSGLGAPSDQDGEPADLPADRWIQPFPADRADLRLALIAGMQVLPAPQRAVLLLRDVLDFPAADVADMLNISVAAVKSRLQRARTTLNTAAPVVEDVVEPTAPEARRLLDTYVRAFETAQVELLTTVLRADASLELVPSQAWYAGKAACVPVLAAAVGEPGDWRMRCTVVNGQPAVVAHLHGEPFGVAVLDTRSDGIAAITVFGDPSLVDRFSA
jgi:RNA polymerase sigma-70 factor (ECF subfamily)